MGHRGRVLFQAPVDRAHPLARDLVCFWLPQPNNSGGARLFDVAGFAFSHGTLSGPTWVPGPGGVLCPTFDGSNDRIDCGTPLVDGQQVRSAFTVVADCVTTTTSSSGGAGGLRNLIVKENIINTSDTAWIVRYNPPSSRLEFYTATGSTFYGPATYSGVAANTRYHVVAAYDTATGLELYVNGASAGTAAGSGSAVNSSAAEITIGASVSGGTRAWQGPVHGAMFYNRRLAAAEVWRLYREAVNGYPDLLGRVPPKARRFVTGASPPPPPPAPEIKQPVAPPADDAAWRELLDAFTVSIGEYAPPDDTSPTPAAPDVGRAVAPPAADAQWQVWLDGYAFDVREFAPPDDTTASFSTFAPLLNPVRPPEVDAFWDQLVGSWFHDMGPRVAAVLTTLPVNPLPQAGTAGKALIPTDAQAAPPTREALDRIREPLNSLMADGRLVRYDVRNRKWTITSGFNATRAPAVTDDVSIGAQPGMVWADTDAQTVYVCVANTAGAAVWLRLVTA